MKSTNKSADKSSFTEIKIRQCSLPKTTKTFSKHFHFYVFLSIFAIVILNLFQYLHSLREISTDTSSVSIEIQIFITEIDNYN